MRVEFTIPGPATPERKRQVPPKGNFHGARVDTPEAKDYKAVVRLAAARAMHEAMPPTDAPPEPLRSPLRLTLVVYRAKPKQPQNSMYPVTRPDCSNYTKLIEDALNGIVWADDAQVCEQRISKRFGVPCVTVKVETMEAIDDAD